MTPSSSVQNRTAPFQGEPLTAAAIYKPLDFTSTQTLFLFPPMSTPSKAKSKAPAAANTALDPEFYVAPTASSFWSAFNHTGSRFFVNALKRLASNTVVPVSVATSAMSFGIRHVVRIYFAPNARLFANAFSSAFCSLRSAVSSPPKTFSPSSALFTNSSIWYPNPSKSTRLSRTWIPRYVSSPIFFSCFLFS